MRSMSDDIAYDVAQYVMNLDGENIERLASDEVLAFHEQRLERVIGFAQEGLDHIHDIQHRRALRRNNEMGRLRDGWR